MNKDELVTKGDLEIWMDKVCDRVVNELTEIIRNKGKFMLSAREFAYQTGMAYNTVLDHCRKGLIKAHQAAGNGKWLIPRTEIQRNLDDALNG